MYYCTILLFSFLGRSIVYMLHLSFFFLVSFGTYQSADGCTTIESPFLNGLYIAYMIASGTMWIKLMTAGRDRVSRSSSSSSSSDVLNCCAACSILERPTS